MTDGKIQTYVCRLQKDRVLRVSDVGGHSAVHDAEASARVGHALTCKLPHEQVWAILLSNAHEIWGTIRIGEGGLNGCAIRPSDVLRPVLCSGVSAFVLIHNHPSGDPTPSAADREMTAHLYRACEVVGVALLDHVIVTRDFTRWHAMGPTGEL